IAYHESLGNTQVGQASDRHFELAVHRLVIPHLGGYTTQPDMRFCDIGAFVQALGQPKRLAGHVARPFRAALLDAELAKAEQDVASPDLQLRLMAELERAIEMRASGDAVPLRQQDEAEVVLRTRQRDAIPQDLEQSNGATGVSRRSLHLSRLPVGEGPAGGPRGQAAQAGVRQTDIPRL